MKEIKYVYQVRSKKTGRVLGGGHGTKSGLYPTLKGLKSAYRNSSWYYWNKKNGEEFEVVKYRLVEEKVLPIQYSEDDKMLIEDDSEIDS